MSRSKVMAQRWPLLRRVFLPWDPRGNINPLLRAPARVKEDVKEVLADGLVHVAQFSD